MTIEIPTLDDREYDELLEDARKQIPIHTTEWTDHNAHDPGITVLELLAWIAETYIYQLDRITEAQIRKYLALMGVRPDGPRPAVAPLAVGLPPSIDSATVPAGESLAVEVEPRGETLRFETTTDVTVTRARIGSVLSEHRTGTTDNTTANGTEGLHFLALGTEAEPGSVMYLGIDGDPFPGSTTRLDVTVAFHDDLPEPGRHGDEPVDFEPSVGVSWQYCTDYDRWYRDDAWAAFDVLRDETNGLYRGGLVTLGKPDDWNDEVRAILDREESFRWIRCVVTPRRDGDDPAGELAVCEGARRIGTRRRWAGAGDRHEIPPQLDWVALNVVTARHRAELRRPDDPVLLTGAAGGTETTAWPDQQFEFDDEFTAVLDADVRLVDHDTVPPESTPWTSVPDLDASGPDDRHYVLDRTGGTVTFGDGIAGRVPAAGLTVAATRIVYGGGSVGNVPADSTWRFTGDEYESTSLTQLAPATGGSDEESVEAALNRLKDDLTVPYRAVTAADYRYVARHTPGLRVGRARASIDASDPSREVRVVVVPHSPRTRPRPTRAFLETVRCHLKRHALLTDRVTVEPPTYVGVSVGVVIRPLPSYTADGRITAVEDALDAFLHPLTGFDGSGWPFGRSLYTSEVYDVVEDVEGVDCVVDVSLTAYGDHAIERGNVVIDDSALFVPDGHDVVVRTDRDECEEVS